jgi:hypothetical protein
MGMPGCIAAAMQLQCSTAAATVELLGTQGNTPFGLTPCHSAVELYCYTDDEHLPSQLKAAVANTTLCSHCLWFNINLEKINIPGDTEQQCCKQVPAPAGGSAAVPFERTDDTNMHSSVRPAGHPCAQAAHACATPAQVLCVIDRLWNPAGPVGRLPDKLLLPITSSCHSDQRAPCESCLTQASPPGNKSFEMMGFIRHQAVPSTQLTE